MIPMTDSVYQEIPTNLICRTQLPYKVAGPMTSVNKCLSVRRFYAPVGNETVKLIWNQLKSYYLWCACWTWKRNRWVQRWHNQFYGTYSEQPFITFQNASNQWKHYSIHSKECFYIVSKWVQFPSEGSLKGLRNNKTDRATKLLYHLLPQIFRLLRQWSCGAVWALPPSIEFIFLAQATGAMVPCR